MASILWLPEKPQRFKFPSPNWCFARVLWGPGSKMRIYHQCPQVQFWILFIWRYLSKIGDHCQDYSPSSKLFSKRQESVRKYVERAFGVLQAHFAIIHGPAQNMDKAKLDMIMKASVMLHNMIIRDEWDSYDLAFEYDDVEDNTPQPNLRRDHHLSYTAYVHRVVQVHDPELHARLQSDLVKEIWNQHMAWQISQT